jgi:hypothetical protein
MQDQKTTLTIPGIIVYIGTEIQGENWKKRDFVIKTKGNYPKDVHFSAWNNAIEQLSRCKENDHVDVSFNPTSRLHNDKYYTELQAWKINIDFNAIKEGGQQ